MLRRCLYTVFLMLATATAPGQDSLVIGMIDFYGLLTITEDEIRALLPFTEGDTVSPDDIDLEAIVLEIEQSLGVHRGHINGVCCSAPGVGGVFIGVEETPVPGIAYRAEPTGEMRLPREILETEERLDAAFEAALQANEMREDQSQGHALMMYPEVRVLQLSFIDYARRYRDLLIDVLHGSARQRALAARVLAYAEDKAGVVPHLELAVLDPNDGVRNDATRALALIAIYGNERPELGIEIDAGLFIRMLSSVVWTDRNKASFLLEALTQARDPVLLARLRDETLPALIEMCAWRDEGFAFPSCRILERALGLPDREELHPRETTIALGRELLSGQ